MAPGRRPAEQHPGRRQHPGDLDQVAADQHADWCAPVGDGRRFPVERLSIVVQDLRFVEHVTGRLGYGTAALQGLLSGAGIGALPGSCSGSSAWWSRWSPG